MVLDGKDFGIWLGYEDRALLDEIGAFIKEAKKSSLPLFHHVRTQHHLWTRKWALNSTELAGVIILDF